MCKINPRVDFAFKLIFGNEQNKDILISLLNSILGDYQKHPIADIEILNPMSEKEYDKDKLTILDIKARDNQGEYYNIEMQISDQDYYQKRALYYWAKLYNSQLGEGKAYSNLKRTVSINILNFDTLMDEKDYHSVYRLKNLQSNLELNNQIELHFIELEKFTKELPDLKKTLDRWIYFLKHAEKFTAKNLPVPLEEVDTISKANKILDSISLTSEQRAIYENRLKILRDEDAVLQTAKRKAREEGRKEGREEGRQEGRQEIKYELARKLLKNGYPLEKISELTGLTVDVLKNI